MNDPVEQVRNSKLMFGIRKRRIECGLSATGLPTKEAPDSVSLASTVWIGLTVGVVVMIKLAHKLQRLRRLLVYGSLGI